MANPNLETPDWDWEVVIPSPSPESSPSSSPSAVGGGEIIQSDYFSATPANNADVTSLEEEEDGDDSDNPSWVDPSDISVVVPVVRSSRKRFRSSSPSSSSLSSYCSSPLSPFLGADCSSGVGLEIVGVEVEEEEEEREEVVSRSSFEEKEEKEKKVVVWWKVPMEVVRYCVMRVSPVWSLSMAAAALMGFVMLRRRYLHNKIKRTSLGIQHNLTLDDKKKVSQFMSRAARLNEAFSVVKRVPIIRPALPAPSMTPWPVMSFR